MAAINVFLLVLMAFYIKLAVSDPCSTYNSIYDWRRSTGNIIDPNKHEGLCDVYLPSRWYRFKGKAGGEIPNFCPPMYACGSTAPVWATGPLPDVVGSATRLTAHLRAGSRCRALSWPIRVMKCMENTTAFYVYHLRNTPGCMSYCAGTEVPCAPGFNSPNGFTPNCTNDFPALSDIKVFAEANDSRIQFNCTWKSNATLPQSRFEVTWYQGLHAKGLVTYMYTGSTRSSTIQNTNEMLMEPMIRLGTVVFCSVRSWYSHSPDIKSGFAESNKFFAGIHVEPKDGHFTLQEGGEPVTIHFLATVPILCKHKMKSNCQIRVQIGAGEDMIAASENMCDVVFNTGAANQVKTMELFAKTDFRKDGDHTLILKSQLLLNIDQNDWYKHHDLPQKQITTKDVPTAECSSSGEPNLLTFDKLWYRHYQVGDYVLVENKQRNFYVHARTWTCGTVSCNCGVAAREGKDVIIVDMCHDSVPRPRFASRMQPLPGTFFEVDNTGKVFKISFPSGATIKFRAYYRHGDITVSVPSNDNGHTRGLCGTFDGNKSNELTHKDGRIFAKLDPGDRKDEFTESWRLPAGTSLFYYKGGAANCHNGKQKRYCTCTRDKNGKHYVGCSSTIADKPQFAADNLKQLKSPTEMRCNKRSRRSTDSYIILPDNSDTADYLYDPVLLNISIPTWPTATGKTKAVVEAHCTQSIMNSGPGKICQDLDDFSFQPFITQCVEDIKITDDYAFTSSAILTMQGACEEIFLKNISLWKIDPANNNTFAPPTEMGNALCPNLCSGNGNCVNATCICNGNYTAADCSIEKNKGPTVQAIANHGLCDIRKGSGCLKIRVNGYDFIDSSNLTCQVEQVKITDKPYNRTSNIRRSRGYLLSFREVMCELRSHPLRIIGNAITSPGVPYAGYLVHVSNDGIKFNNNPKLFIVHDANCMDCRPTTGICFVKPGSCYINGYCFRRNENNPIKQCSKCLPEISKSQFSNVKNCTITTTTKVLTTTVSNKSSSTTATFEKSINTGTEEMTTNSPNTNRRSTENAQTSPAKEYSKTTSKGQSRETNQEPTKNPSSVNPERVSSNVKRVVIIAVPSVCGFIFVIVILILLRKRFKKTMIVSEKFDLEMKEGEKKEKLTDIHLKTQHTN